MDEYIPVYLYDVKKAIAEVESYFVGYTMRYENFERDFLRRSAVDFPLPNARAVIDTRNRIIHGYDSVKPEFLWGLVMRHIPALKNDLENVVKELDIRLPE